MKRFVATLNEVFSTLSLRRRYEVWFLRLGLSDGSGAWWLRYLLMNPGRAGCEAKSQAQPVQIWATWFPASGRPQSFIQGFPLDQLDLSNRGQAPFHLRAGDNAIEEDSCRGALNVDGHQVTWNLRYRSTVRVTLSSKGWIGFSRTPHSDAVFSGKIMFDGRSFAGDPLGFGVQGHNCGYRHRKFWTWAHAYFLRPGKPATTLEALTYEMPFGFLFRKAVLWHDGQQHIFRNLKETAERENMLWNFCCTAPKGIHLRATIDGRGDSVQRFPYTKTDCSGTFEVANNSLASASLLLERAGRPVEILETNGGAVLEVVGCTICGNRPRLAVRRLRCRLPD
jgi:hypothetical protein